MLLLSPTVDRGSGLLDQPGPGQQTGGRRLDRSRSGVLQMIVDDDARLGIVTAEARRGRPSAHRSPVPDRLLLLLTVTGPSVVGHPSDGGRSAAVAVHYGLAIVVVHGETTAAVAGCDIDVPASDGKFLVDHRRAGRRFAVKVVLLLLLLLFRKLFRLGGVHVHQRSVPPHGHAGQNFVTAAGLFELPHGFRAFDLFALSSDVVLVGDARAAER